MLLTVVVFSFVSISSHVFVLEGWLFCTSLEIFAEKIILGGVLFTAYVAVD